MILRRSTGNKPSRFFVESIVVVSASIFLFCGTNDASAQSKLKTALIKINDVTINVEVATTAREHTRGLMYRDKVQEGTGMLFVYPKPRRAEFWMRHTYVPLSVAFIREDGYIIQILDMKYINSHEIYRSNEKVKYALEVPLGFFEKKRIKVGDSCIFE